MQDGDTATPANDLLRAARLACPSPSLPGEPMSRTELAEAVNAHLWEVTGRQHALDAHALARYERGAVRWPNSAYRSGLRAVLGARRDADLGFRPSPRRPTDITHQAATTSGPIDEQVASLLDRLGTTRVGRADVHELRRFAGLLAAQTQIIGGGTLRRAAYGAYSGVRTLLDEADYTQDVGAQLVRAAGEFAVCAGWTAYDVGDQRIARTLFTDGLLLAGQDNDTALSLRALNALTLQAAHLADGGRRRGPSREAWRYAQRMADHARSERSTQLHALIAGHQVVATALVGHDPGFHAAVARAWRETDRLDPQGEPAADWLRFVGPDAVATYVARGHRYRAEPEQGVDVFREYVREAEASPWNRANYRAQLAATLAESGDTARAAELGREVLDDLDRAAISSPRTEALLEPVCRSAK
jgi:hypothetical protein